MTMHCPTLTTHFPPTDHSLPTTDHAQTTTDLSATTTDQLLPTTDHSPSMEYSPNPTDQDHSLTPTAWPLTELDWATHWPLLTTHWPLTDHPRDTRWPLLTTHWTRLTACWWNNDHSLIPSVCVLYIGWSIVKNENSSKLCKKSTKLPVIPLWKG